jgi:hypothetical protein
VLAFPSVTFHVLAHPAPAHLPRCAAHCSSPDHRPSSSPAEHCGRGLPRPGGVLEIPAVESYTSFAIFVSLLAYEQSHGRRELQRLVSYVLLMASQRRRRPSTRTSPRSSARRPSSWTTATRARRVRSGTTSGGVGTATAPCSCTTTSATPGPACPPPPSCCSCSRAVVQTVYTVLPYYNTNSSG